jgi:TonB family protein
MKSKINTMKSRPQVSDEEIQRYMNFDKLLSEKKRVDARKKIVTRVTGIGAAILCIAILIAILKTSSQESPQPKGQSPEIVKSELGKVDSITREPQPQTLKESGPAGFSKSKKPQQKASKSSKDVETVDLEPPQQKPDTGYVQAEPLAGYPDLYAYFDRELIYPKEAMNNPVEGVVTVTITISKRGNPENVKILNSLGESFDKEAIRVIKKMPSWKPARYNGRPVASKVSVPLTFQFKKLN